MVVTGDRATLEAQDALVVPGVGAFEACMAGLRAVGGPDLIAAWVADARPLLGICVGHQILFDTGTEHGRAADGLGVFPGSVDQLPARRLPHMGWNTVTVPQGSRLFSGIESERFYFVHSYAASEGPADAVVTTAQHEGATFVAALERDAVASTQFHPEKSGAAGARLLANWLTLW